MVVALITPCGLYNYTMTTLKEPEYTAGAAHSLGYHVIWCPKYRKNVLIGGIAERLKELLRTKAAENGWSVEALEVMPDHVHIFVRCPPLASPSYIANQFKGFTSHTLRKEFPHLRTLLPTLWSKSYYIATVGEVFEDVTKRYINEQSTKPTRGVP